MKELTNTGRVTKGKKKKEKTDRTEKESNTALPNDKIKKVKNSLERKKESNKNGVE